MLNSTSSRVVLGGWMDVEQVWSNKFLLGKRERERESRVNRVRRACRTQVAGRRIVLIVGYLNGSKRKGKKRGKEAVVLCYAMECKVLESRVYTRQRV